jgi:hypothetical protein
MTVPAGSARATRTASSTTSATLRGSSDPPPGGILNYHTVAVPRREPDKSQGHDRAKRMTSQDVHRPWQLCEDVLNKVINGQLARTGSAA